ncbi:MAG: tyrosine-type recombinase/integrase [Brevinema sp.]
MLEEQLSLFLQRMTFERISSQNTIKAYKHDIEKFIVSLGDQELTIGFISEWIEQLHHQKKSVKTIARTLSALRSFFNFLVKKDIVACNYFDLFRIANQHTHIPFVLSEKKMLNLLFQLPEHNILARRNKCMLVLMYSSGIRSEELCLLKCSDLFLDQEIMKIFGKGQKERFVPLLTYTKDLIKSWLQDREKINKHNSTYLFLSKNGHQLTTSMIRKIIDVLPDIDSETKHLHPHAFRYACATHLLNAGANLRHIQELLGHANLSVTQRYTKLSLGSMKEKFYKYHPRG